VRGRPINRQSPSPVIDQVLNAVRVKNSERNRPSVLRRHHTRQPHMSHAQSALEVVPRHGPTKLSDSCPGSRLVDVQIDAEQEQRPEHNRQHRRAVLLRRLQVSVVVVRGGDDRTSDQVRECPGPSRRTSRVSPRSPPVTGSRSSARPASPPDGRSLSAKKGDCRGYAEKRIGRPRQSS
jgi:hypothetical protein